MIHLDYKCELLFLCDRQNHCVHPCYDQCRHTSHKEWALHKDEDSWQFIPITPIHFFEDEGGWYKIMQDRDEDGIIEDRYTIVLNETYGIYGIR